MTASSIPARVVRRQRPGSCSARGVEVLATRFVTPPKIRVLHPTSFYTGGRGPDLSRSPDLRPAVCFGIVCRAILTAQRRGSESLGSGSLRRRGQPKDSAGGRRYGLIVMFSPPRPGCSGARG